MATWNVVLTDGQSAFVYALVNSGRFQNASAALRAGLRLPECVEAIWDPVRAGMLQGLELARRGQIAEGTGEEVMQRIIDDLVEAD